MANLLSSENRSRRSLTTSTPLLKRRREDGDDKDDNEHQDENITKETEYSLLKSSKHCIVFFPILGDRSGDNIKLYVSDPPRLEITVLPPNLEEITLMCGIPKEEKIMKQTGAKNSFSPDFFINDLLLQAKTRVFSIREIEGYLGWELNLQTPSKVVTERFVAFLFVKKEADAVFVL